MIIPRLWLGTRKMTDPILTPELVAWALAMGYRHIDTAHIYGNHYLIKQGIQERWGNRDDFFLATKRWRDMYQDPLGNLERMIDDLGTIPDLVYLHRPTTQDDHDHVFTQAQSILDRGLTKAIGISNFPLSECQRLYDKRWSLISAHQYEAHALFDQWHNRTWCIHHNVTPIAYSPFWHGHLFGQQWVEQIMPWCQKNWLTPSQVYLAYLIRQWYVVLPKASSISRLRDNLVSQDIALDDAITTILDSFPKSYRYCNPPFAQWDKIN